MLLWTAAQGAVAEGSTAMDVGKIHNGRASISMMILLPEHLEKDLINILCCSAIGKKVERIGPPQ